MSLSGEQIVLIQEKANKMRDKLTEATPEMREAMLLRYCTLIMIIYLAFDMPNLTPVRSLFRGSVDDLSPQEVEAIMDQAEIDATEEWDIHPSSTTVKKIK